MTYMLDSCIIIEILKGNEKAKKNAQKAKLGGEKISIDGICYYEVKRGLMDADATAQLASFRSLALEFC